MGQRAKKKQLTTGQVAEICGVAPRTVTKWIDKGTLKGYRIPGSKDRRVVGRDLVDFMVRMGMPTDMVPGGMTVLVVGCNEPELFNAGGVGVTFAATQFRAGVEFATRRPSCVVVDLEIGRVDAAAIARECKAAGVPCVALTLRWSVGEMVADGFDDAIGKGTDDIGAQIRAVVDEHANAARTAAGVSTKGERRAS